MLLNWKDVDRLPEVAATVNEPPMDPAVSVGVVAIPDELVKTVTDELPVNVPVAPLVGAVNVTLAKSIGLPYASVSLTDNLVPYEPPTLSL